MTEPSFEQSQASMRPHEDPVSLPKILLISSLALATLVPTFFVSGLIAEREARQGVVQSEFTRNWGPPQELRSPTLVVPYQSAPDRPCGYLKITPDRLSVTANLTPQERKRGLFHATVYDAKVEMQGVFVLPTESRLRGVLSGRPLWNESFIALSTTSLTGLRSEDQITVDGTETPWRPCAESAGFEWDCKSASLILASAPVAAAPEQRVVPGDDQPPRYRRIQPALCRQATRRVDAIALEDAELRREHPSRKRQRNLAGFRSALADDLVRLAADLDRWGNS